MRNGLPTIGPSTKDSAPENVTLCTTSVPAAVSLSSCSNSIRKSGILDSTVNDLSGTTEMKFIGTAIPLAGVIRPRLPVWNGPSIDDALVSGSQIFQLLTSAYISNIFLGGTEIMMRLSTCTRALQGRLKFARRNLPLQRGAEFLLLSLAKVSTVTGGTRLKSCQPVSDIAERTDSSQAGHGFVVEGASLRINSVAASPARWRVFRDTREHCAIHAAWPPFRDHTINRS